MRGAGGDTAVQAPEVRRSAVSRGTVPRPPFAQK